MSENEYIGLSPLTMEDIRNFFNTYIKPFAPYREEKVYDTLINNLTEYYYNQTYINIPTESKQIYEEANFNTPSIYDKLLVAIGVPSEIIENISFSDKLIFLRTLSDFERYKGTVSFFQKVAESFSDRVSIYELFIDYDGTNWFFKPVKLYLHSDMEINITSIPYSTIYNAVPSLILSEEQLTSLYDDEKLILPLKSNLMLLDNDLMSDASVLYDVIVAVFLHTYKENYIDLYFKDDTKTTQLKTIYFLWYYLLTRYYGIPWTAFNMTLLLKFVYGDVGFPSFIGTTPTTIDSLSQIIDRYDNIKIISTPARDYDDCQALRDSFYKDISLAFYTQTTGSATTFTDMYNELLIMNSALITYIDDRINDSVIGTKPEINLILTEIYSSLLLYSSMYSSDAYFSLYVDYFLRYLPQVLINPENTTAYTILYNLKPYHVELYSICNTGVRSQDKFNQVYIDDEDNLSFLHQIVFASALDFSNDYLFSYDYFTESSLSILSSMNFNIFAILPDEDEGSNISDSETFETYIPSVSAGNLSDDYLPPDIIFSPESSISMISTSEYTMFVPVPDDSEIASDLDTVEFILSEASFGNLSDDYLPPEIVFSPESSVSMISAENFNLLSMIDDLFDILESTTVEPSIINVSAGNISDDYVVTKVP